MTSYFSSATAGLAMTALALFAGPMIATAHADETVSLFKVVTVRDEIVIGFSDDELERLGGKDAAAVAKALKDKGTFGVWQYAVRRSPSGDLEQAPLRQIGLMSTDSLRVEPYVTPLKINPKK